MKDTVREQMLAGAERAGNALASWVDEHPEAGQDARVTQVLELGQALLRELLALMVGAGRSRSLACPRCGLRPVRRQRPRTL